MTALVGILNKHAAALAADSTVIVSNSHGTKIYNTSRKIFHISSKNPVDFMKLSIPFSYIAEIIKAKSGREVY